MRNILTKNVSKIQKYLKIGPDGMNEAEILRWIQAMQKLYSVASVDIHEYNSEVVVINATHLGEDEVELARAICEATPIPHITITVREDEVMHWDDHDLVLAVA